MNMIDGIVDDANNHWHSNWDDATAIYPHWVEIDLGASYYLSSFRYLPRYYADGGLGNGTIGGYEIYVSMDGITWGSAVKTGTWAKDATEKVANFDATQIGRFVKLIATSEVNNNIHAQATEVFVHGVEILTPIADFSVDPSTIYTGREVKFTDLTTYSPTDWSWLFDGGTPATSTDQNPAATFAMSGDHDVTLTVTNGEGVSSTVTKNITVVDLPAPVANFSADPYSIFAEKSVSFTDLTTNFPTEWSWSLV